MGIVSSPLLGAPHVEISWGPLLRSVRPHLGTVLWDCDRVDKALENASFLQGEPVEVVDFLDETRKSPRQIRLRDSDIDWVFDAWRMDVLTSDDYRDMAKKYRVRLTEPVDALVALLDDRYPGSVDLVRAGPGPKGPGMLRVMHWFTRPWFTEAPTWTMYPSGWIGRNWRFYSSDERHAGTARLQQAGRRSAAIVAAALALRPQRQAEADAFANAF